jgi:hypothetical protein
MLRRRIEREIKDVLREDQFEFRRGKEIGNEIGVVGISKRTYGADEELCACFIKVTEGI